MPPERSVQIPLADFPILLWGRKTAGLMSSGIFFISICQRPPLWGFGGRLPIFGAWSYHLLPSGLPMKCPGFRWRRMLVPFQVPWLSV